jgi:hypothetical protein
VIYSSDSVTVDEACLYAEARGRMDGKSLDRRKLLRWYPPHQTSI